MGQNSSQISPEATIAEYIEACRAGSAERLQTIFHPNAQMAGYYQGDFYIGNPKPFFDEIRDNGNLSKSGVAYTGDITRVEVAGDVASVTLKEEGYFGVSLTNWFHLAMLDGRWEIISKSYQDE